MFEKLKKLIRSNARAYQLVSLFYNYWRPPLCDIASILSAFDTLKNHNVVFVQVGSNDGVTGDPIHSFITATGSSWSGMLIEPVPYLFEKLKATYRGYEARLKFVNMAVGPYIEKKILYRIKEESGQASTPWYEQIASFSHQTILKQKPFIPDFDRRLIEEAVNVAPLRKIAADNAVTEPDLVHIDTEGFDFEVIKLIDWTGRSPEVLLFEHKHLSRQDYHAACRLLRSKNYIIFSKEGDTIAIRQSTYLAFRHLISCS
jgi:FkbM family methyltransferase